MCQQVIQAIDGHDSVHLDSQVKVVQIKSTPNTQAEQHSFAILARTGYFQSDIAHARKGHESSIDR